MNQETCWACMEKPATTKILHDDHESEMVCQNCHDHIMLSGCTDERCPLCPSGIPLEDAVKWAQELGITIESS